MGFKELKNKEWKRLTLYAPQIEASARSFNLKNSILFLYLQEFTPRIPNGMNLD
jgi:hypothetical protein